MSQYLILDYYVDEPACLGVPPYISPYVRYLYGAIQKAVSVNNSNSENNDLIDYLTIDELRQQNFIIASDKKYIAIFIIAGSTVPGKYLAGNIGSYAEIFKFIDKNIFYVDKIFAGGPIQYLSQNLKDKLFKKGVYVIKGELEIFAYEFLQGQMNNSIETKKPSANTLNLIPIEKKYKKDYSQIRDFAILGSALIVKHFRYPYVMIELETYMGCTRDSYCSFCTESFYGKPIFRKLEDIIDEVKALYEKGALYFRLGRQADLFTYQANLTIRRKGFPQPNVKAVENLYTDIRKVAPQLKVLHLDNTNPGGISAFPEESIAITKIISTNNTTMDTAAMGIESFDDNVVKANNLKSTGEDSLKAIQLIHENSIIKNGFSSIAPGINLLGGLIGENEKTFEINYNSLKQLLDHKVTVRRINIRTVMTYENTKFAQYKKTNKEKINPKRLSKKFDYFKKKIRTDIDSKMLALAFPKGSIIKDVIIEKKVPHGFLGRPLGSYPITCHILQHSFQVDDNTIKNIFPPYTVTDVIIIGYKERAIYALSIEEDFRNLPLHILKRIIPNDLAHQIWSNGIDKYIDFIPQYLLKYISK